MVFDHEKLQLQYLFIKPDPLVSCSLVKLLLRIMPSFPASEQVCNVAPMKFPAKPVALIITHDSPLSAPE
jgi:hypothetical protein